MLARMSSRHPERMLTDLRAVGDAMAGLDAWLTVHTYLVAMLGKFRGAVDPLRQLAREIVAPFEDGGSPLAEWYRAASAGVPALRCVFEDNELHRDFVRDLLLRHGDEGVLGEHYREGSVVIEPDTNHFDLERPEMVQRQLEALLAMVEAAGQGTGARTA
jgi:hypothetical protein